MLSVKGTFQNGVAQPAEPVEGHNGQTVIITFLEQDDTTLPPGDDAAWDAFERLIDQCTVDTGIEDLAHQHDHYFHGTPKRETYP